MIHTIRLIRTQFQPPSIVSSLLPAALNRKTSSVRFTRSACTQQPQDPEDMDSTNNPAEKTGDEMSHSFGEAYATRSDEEGFGGIYGGNQTLDNSKTDPKIHENHPGYDKKQGSEVTDKEKARNQTRAS